MPNIDIEALAEALERAGATLVALPATHLGPVEYGSAWPDVVRAAHEAYGWQPGETRYPVPSARDITEMDRLYAVVNRLPPDRRTWRRLLLMRSLCHPITGRHLWSWRKIARALGWSHTYVQSQWQIALTALAIVIDAGQELPGIDTVDKKRHDFRYARESCALEH